MTSYSARVDRMISRGIPRVSVIVPAFNQARYLPETVDSVLRQSFKDFEVIIIDDGSTDDTPDVARSILDTRVQYARQANRGPSAARNAGLRHAVGEYIAFLDSDDILLPCHLETLVRL